MTLDDLKDSINLFEWHLEDWALKNGGNPKTDKHIQMARQKIIGAKNLLKILELK